MSTRDDVTQRPYRSVDAVERHLKGEWRAFLSSGEMFDFSSPDPVVSVVIVLYGRVELTLECLRRLRESGVQAEVILVDNASRDATSHLLGRVRGAKIVRNEQNEGFLRGANAGAALATAPALLFLNTDAFVHPGALAAALQRLDEGGIGAVGGRVMFADGTLQEAGCRVGPGGMPVRPRGYKDEAVDLDELHDVDYCSGCFLLTRTALFHAVGGFDDRFTPGYYEDVDYCLRVWGAGQRVVYEPQAAVTHLCGASIDPGMRLDLMRAHGPTFRELHADWKSPVAWPLRVLIVDDRLPRPTDGSGYPRTIQLVRACAQLGYAVTLLGVTGGERTPEEAGIPEGNVRFIAAGSRGVEAFLADEERKFDVVWVSRPHNMKRVKAGLRGRKLVYDAEAIFAVRDIVRARLLGKSTASAEKALEEELALADGAAAVSCVTEAEAERFRARGHRAFVVSHAASGASKPLEERRGVVWVGGLPSGSPNADALRWYLDKVRPHLTTDDHLVVVGDDKGTPIKDAWVVGVASPELLTDILSSARCMIVPMRWAAGVPLKGITGLAHGLPLVTTQLAADQLGLPDPLATDDPAEFAALVERVCTDDELWKVQNEQAQRVMAERFSFDAFRTSVASVFEALHTSVGGETTRSSRRENDTGDQPVARRSAEESPQVREMSRGRSSEGSLTISGDGS